MKDLPVTRLFASRIPLSLSAARAAPLTSVRAATLLATLALAALMLAVAPEAARAQSAGPAKHVDPQNFKSMVEGKTIYFELEDGSLWGREFYRPGGNKTVFIHETTGECLNGHWTREGDRYCYYYREEPSCWLTFYEGDTIIVESRDGSRQRIRKIVSNEPLSCDPGLISRAPETAPGAVPHDASAAGADALTARLAALARDLGARPEPAPINAN